MCSSDLLLLQFEGPPLQLLPGQGILHRERLTRGPALIFVVIIVIVVVVVISVGDRFLSGGGSLGCCRGSGFPPPIPSLKERVECRGTEIQILCFGGADNVVL